MEGTSITTDQLPEALLLTESAAWFQPQTGTWIECQIAEEAANIWPAIDRDATCELAARECDVLEPAWFAARR